MLALPAVFAAVPGLLRCSCCGGVYSKRRVRGLPATPGIVICSACARSATAPAGRRH